MQFVVEREAFLKELSRVTGVIATRNTIPIVANVRIDAGAGGLLLRATDLDMEAEAPCAADVTSQGLTTVDGKLLADFVKRCPDGAQIAVTLEEARGRLKLVCGRARSTLPCLPAEDFPELSGPSGEAAREFPVEADSLKRLIGRVKFAATTDERRHYLQGAYLHQTENGLAAVCTNGHQLSLAHLDLPAGADGLTGVILPRPFLAELMRLLPKEGEAALSVSPERVAVTLGEFRLTSRLIDGTYPDYPRVIPQKTDRRAFVERAALVKALERVMIVSEPKQSGVSLAFAAGELRLGVESQTRGICADGVDAVYEGETLQTGANGRYLLDICGALHCERLCIHLGADPSHALRITNAEAPDSPDLIVLMPMAVRAIHEEREAA